MKNSFFIICFFLQVITGFSTEERYLCQVNINLLSQIKWMARDQIFHARILASMNTNKKSYKRLFDNKSPFIAYLQSLGIKFWYNSNGEFKIELPQLSFIYQMIESQSEDLVRKGAKQDEVIKPIVIIPKVLDKKLVGKLLDGDPYYKTNTRYTSFSFGDILERDQQLFSREDEGYVTDIAAFYYFLKNGKHPISVALDSDPNNEGAINTSFEHDLSHFFGMYQHKYRLKYQKGFILLAKEALEEESRRFMAIPENAMTKSFGDTHETKMGKEGFNAISENQIEVTDSILTLRTSHNSPLINRRYYYNEGMVFVKEGEADTLKEYLGIPDKVWNSGPEKIFKEVLKFIKTKKESGILKKFEGINFDLEKFFTAYGGAANNIDFDSRDYSELHHVIGLLTNFERMINNGIKFSENNVDERYEYYAFVIALIARMSKLNEKQFIEGYSIHGMPEELRLKDIFCFKRDLAEKYINRLVKAFCN